MNKTPATRPFLFDADQHYYEPRDAFTRYNDDPEAGMVEVMQVGDREQIRIGGIKHEYPPTFESVAPPGSILELLESPKGRGNDNPIVEQIKPDYQRRTERIATMDAQGVDAALLLPTLAVTVEHPMRNDIRRTFANLRAFNRWIDADWGFDRDGRLYALPLLSLIDPDEAVRELERVLEAGAKGVHLLAGPANGCGPGDPIHDRFWSLINETGTLVGFHGADSGYTGLIGQAWGEQYPVRVHHMSAWARAFCFIDAPIMHTLGSLVYSNLFDRFPNVRILCLEHGSAWLPYLLERLDKVQAKLTTRTPWPREPLTERASDVFREHIWVSPYPEDDMADVLEMMPASRVLFGSDWPHPEGLADPLTFAERLPEISAHDRDQIMGGNLATLLGIEAEVPPNETTPTNT